MHFLLGALLLLGMVAFTGWMWVKMDESNEIIRSRGYGAHRRDHD